MENINEEQLNSDIRKFLKQFGVAAHRALYDAATSAARTGGEPLNVRATLHVEGLDMEFVIEEDIRVS